MGNSCGAERPGADRLSYPSTGVSAQSQMPPCPGSFNDATWTNCLGTFAWRDCQMYADNLPEAVSIATARRQEFLWNIDRAAAPFECAGFFCRLQRNALSFDEKKVAIGHDDALPADVVDHALDAEVVEARYVRG